MSTRIGVPSVNQPLVDEQGRLSQVWFRFFQSMVNQPPAATQITVGASPFAYVVNVPGTVFISGGTVTGLSVSRGTASVSITGQSVPVSQGDIVTVTYSVLPDVWFFPS